jgi:hypothetical protein
MNPEKFNEIFEHAFEHAKVLMQKEGDLMPTAFIFTTSDNGHGFDCQILPMPMADDTQKEFLRRLLVTFAKKVNACAVMFVSEAWIASCAPEDWDSFRGPVRDYPDRKEALVLHGRTSFINRLRTQEFTKGEGGTYIFGKSQDLFDSSDYCAFTDGIFPESAMTRH